MPHLWPALRRVLWEYWAALLVGGFWGQSSHGMPHVIRIVRTGMRPLAALTAATGTPHLAMTPDGYARPLSRPGGEQTASLNSAAPRRAGTHVIPKITELVLQNPNSIRDVEVYGERTSVAVGGFPPL
ncbi:hypothetical protein DUI87_32400 [Hirundo rustica rustica]|uniref:Uncharacterized protein n=1 Tax=Hirundo rustica rustica TaxID=333673 RepID=A0A3M0IRW8_HIRRU|nr:hypothetical protein DUI87_32400 [Hirundo rustica rustica]